MHSNLYTKASDALIVESFLCGTKKKIRNKETDGKSVFYYGSEIAKWVAKDKIAINAHGYVNKSTCEFLNNIIAGFFNNRRFPRLHRHGKTEYLFVGMLDNSIMGANENLVLNRHKSTIDEMVDNQTTIHWSEIKHMVNMMTSDELKYPVIIHVNNKLSETLDVIDIRKCDVPIGNLGARVETWALEVVYDE